MQLKVKLLKWSAGRPVAILHKKTAEKLNIYVDDRISISKNNKKIISVVDVASRMLAEDEIAISVEISKILGIKRGIVNIEPASKPKSIELIQKKLNCQKLSKSEVKAIVQDIVNNALTESEIAYFISANYKCGFEMDEAIYLTESIVETGKKLNLKGKIVDKHGIGGIPGNRTTPIIVSICAAAGLIMPKTSSRAITTAAGTADVIETIAKVDFSVNQLKKIIEKTNACLIWGDSLGLAPADDKIIKVERLLNLDPETQLLASIMAKKISVGSKYVLIDIPYGKTAKVSHKQALSLKKKFEHMGKYFKMKMKVILTRGEEPIGNGIGPALEIKDILKILKQDNSRPIDLEKKSIFLAGQIFELAGKVKKSHGLELAKKILYSGQAFKKFRQIILAQKGKLNNLPEAKFHKDILAKKTCKILAIDNKKINQLARIAGCPADKASGLYLYNHVDEKLVKGEKILTIYAESKTKLKDAINFYNEKKPIKLK